MPISGYINSTIIKGYRSVENNGALAAVLYRNEGKLCLSFLSGPHQMEALGPFPDVATADAQAEFYYDGELDYDKGE